jgi:catechol 2,3-dioxygenase-like lactoylglutathione lyase family enzyme
MLARTRKMIDRFAVLAVLALGLSQAAFAGQSSQAGATGKVVRPNAIIHSVANLERSVAFYRDAVGLPLDPTASAADVGRDIQALTGVRDANIQTATFTIPGSELRLVLAQFQGRSASGAVTSSIRVQDPGVVKLVLRVRDIDAAFAAVRPTILSVYSTGGAPVHPEGPGARVQAVIVKDPDGCALEFVLGSAEQAAAVPAGSNVIGGWASLVGADLDRMVALYRDRLGFAVPRPPRPLPPSVLALEGTPDAAVTNIGTRPPGSSSTWFLYDFRKIDRQMLPARLEAPGMAAVSFWVDNLPALLDSVKAAGATTITPGGTPASLSDHARALLVRGPDGILIELAEQSR